MDEETDTRLDLLLKLTQADVETRLIREVLADLTPTEKKQLKARVTAAVEARIAQLTADQLDRSLAGTIRMSVEHWVRSEATAEGNKSWGAVWLPKVRAAVHAELTRLFNPETLQVLVEQQVAAHKAQGIRDVVSQAVRYLRDWRPQ